MRRNPISVSALWLFLLSSLRAQLLLSLVSIEKEATQLSKRVVRPIQDARRSQAA